MPRILAPCNIVSSRDHADSALGTSTIWRTAGVAQTRRLLVQQGGM